MFIETFASFVDEHGSEGKLENGFNDGAKMVVGRVDTKPAEAIP